MNFSLPLVTAKYLPRRILAQRLLPARRLLSHRNLGRRRRGLANLTINALAAVSIVASDALAPEVVRRGVFTVSRTGGTAASLAVNYTVGGTATNGVDYQMLSGTVTIPPGISRLP